MPSFMQFVQRTHNNKLFHKLTKIDCTTPEGPNKTAVPKVAASYIAGLHLLNTTIFVSLALQPPWALATAFQFDNHFTDDKDSLDE
jgi:hypothetical protein